jgi:hypothetical protein
LFTFLAFLGALKISLVLYTEDLDGRGHLGDVDVVRNIILKWIVKKEAVMMWTGFI